MTDGRFEARPRVVTTARHLASQVILCQWFESLIHEPRSRLPDVRDRRRGVEFLMNYYPILDRVPKGRDEGDAFQTWIRRHDEYT